jgi:hypothetical protein
MTVHEFYYNVDAAIRSFYKFWLEENKIDPIEYPEEMEEGDWQEQFAVWMEGGIDE